MKAFFANRFLFARLTPALGVLYFVQLTLVRRVTSGPMYTYLVEDLTNPTCKENWWSFFLYIQNYVNRSNLVSLQTFVGVNFLKNQF